MAYSFVYHVGDGVTTNFSIPFSFINRSHVYLKIDGVATSGFTWVNDGAITISPAPADGANVLVYRDTPKDARLVDFSNESHLSAHNLDLSAEQIFFINQEEFDWARRGMDFIDDAQAAAVTAQEYAGYAGEASLRAETLEANAELFMTRAETASNLAELAKGLAVDAKDGAIYARQQAETARDTTLGYRGDAEEAKDQAVTAKDGAVLALAEALDIQALCESYADTVTTKATQVENNTTLVAEYKTAAESARDTAVSAKTAAETARDTAVSAKDSALLAKTGAETAEALAEKWANEAEDTEVEAGLYSARHWSEKAKDYASGGSVAWGNVTDKPSAFPPESHNHDLLYSALAHNHTGVYATASHNHDSAYAPTSHSHSIANVTNLQTTLDGKAASSHNHDTLYSALAHNHTGVYSASDHNHDSVYAAASHSHSYLANLSDDTSPELTGALDCNNKPVYWDIYTISGTTIDVANGNKQKLTLSTTDITVSLSTPSGACAFHLYVYQGDTPRTITWPTMLWLSASPPNLNVASGKFVVCLTWDGTNWFGSWGLYS